MPDTLLALSDFLVTGTDTGIGKTIIAAALVKALRARGVRALGFKPVETGSPSRADQTRPPSQADGQPADPELLAGDSDLLARASGEATPLAIPLLQLAEPLAPAVAAERAGTVVDPEEIETRIDLLRRAGYTLVVEGAGGVMAPFAWQNGARLFYTILDLAAHRGLQAIVVGRPGLGTLNHIGLTVAMLRSRNIPVKAVILNGRRPEPSALRLEPSVLRPEPSALRPEPAPDLAESTNPAALARMLPDVLIIQVPRHDAPDAQASINATVPYMTPLLS